MQNVIELEGCKCEIIGKIIGFCRKEKISFNIKAGEGFEHMIFGSEEDAEKVLEYIKNPPPDDGEEVPDCCELAVRFYL